MNSMTGFGSAEGDGAGVHFAVEMKSLNTRYLDLIISLPSSLTSLEGRVREVLQRIFSRGRIEVNVRARDIEEQLSVAVDAEAAAAWKGALEELAGILDGTQGVTLDMLMKQEGVLKVERVRDTEAYWKVLEPLLLFTGEQVNADRAREGAELALDIESQLQAMERSLSFVADSAPEMRREIEESFKSRFAEILGDDVGEQRILLETAAWIAKTDINEEIVRLETHIGAFRDEVSSEGSKGKKLDFLAQEMGREINTIGSKSPRADISREVVAMKDALEKVREQLRNVE